MSRRILPILFAVAIALLPACRKKQKIDVAASLHPEKMPTMSTVNISTLISDSGVTQYKIVAPLWNVFDEGEDPYWIFPKGIYLQKYDPKLNVIATIAADSAKYFKNRRLWRLDGHVEVRKKPKDLFLSQQVFWDQQRQIVYSDSFIHIENATHVLEGYGFESNENFTSYSVSRPMGIFPVDRSDLTSPPPPAAPVPQREAPTPQREAPTP